MRIAHITTATFLLAAPLLATTAIPAAAQDQSQNQPMAKPCTDSSRTDCDTGHHDYNKSQGYNRQQGNYGGQDTNTRPDNYGHQDNANGNQTSGDRQDHRDNNQNRDYNSDRDRSQNGFNDSRTQARWGDEDRMRGRYGWEGHGYFWHGRRFHARFRCYHFDPDTGWCYR
jgi:hypothetical protein